MRIALNASIVDPILSGLGMYTVNLARELALLHEDLVVYTSHPELCGVQLAKARRISLRVEPSRARRGHLQRLAWIQAFLPFRVLADRVSLLLSPVPEAMLLSFVPQVVVAHDLIPLYFPESFPRQYLYFRYILPLILRRSQAIIAVSENTKRDIMTCYGIEAGRIHVVPNGLDASAYRLGIDAAGIKRRYDLDAYLLFVGNMLPHKNLQRLIRAFASIALKFPHTLVIAGNKDARYHPRLEAEARDLGVADRVVFLDYVPLAELPALYAGADAFVLPSLYEGFGLPILEAMACGIPVVASRIGALPEVAGEAAALIDPHDVPGMASALEAVLGDRELRAGMRRRGLEQAARFSWRNTAMQILRILWEAGKG